MSTSLVGETWRDIDGYEGLYRVSDQGRVWSLARTVSLRDGRTRRTKHRFLSPGVAPDGHLGVCLSTSEGVRRSRTVHSLVAIAFHGPRPEGLECCHKNGIPADNRAVNLRWDTRRENILDAVRHGTHHWASKTHCPSGHSYADHGVYREQHRDRVCALCIEQGQPRRTELQRKRRAALYVDLGPLPPKECQGPACEVVIQHSRHCRTRPIYCSNACRVRAHRSRKKLGVL